MLANVTIVLMKCFVLNIVDNFIGKQQTSSQNVGFIVRLH